MIDGINAHLPGDDDLVAIPQMWGVYDRYMLPKPAAKEIQG